jgi:putative ABC transport system substrate-binding protein
MRRRAFVTLLGGAVAWPLAARAQHAPGKVAHVGIIDDSPSWDPFRQRLRELNYVEGVHDPSRRLL